MRDLSDIRGRDSYWERENLGQQILDALVATGKKLDALTIDELAPFDQFHGGGKSATESLARLATLSPGMCVLDVGGGLGGPARTLAFEFGCAVTVVDLTESYVKAAQVLTNRLGLADQVNHCVGDALALPFDPETFDVVWTQNSGMNIAAKEQLYAGFHRVLRPNGRLVFQEPLAGPLQPLVFPTMWSRDVSTSFLRTPEEMQGTIASAGFQQQAWHVVPMKPQQENGIAMPSQTIADIVMGDAIAAIDHANDRNRDENRMIMVHAVFTRA